MPLISVATQTCLLNNIAIGQFFKMKYIVGKKKKEESKTAIGTILLPFPQHKSATNILKTAPITVKSISRNALGNLLVITSPLLFKKFFSALKVTFEALVIKYGTEMIATQNKIGLLRPKAIKHPTVIPSPNMRFQKLSSLSLDLIKPFIEIIMSILKIPSNSIVPWLCRQCKAIASILVVLMLSLSTTVAFAKYSAGSVENLTTGEKINSARLLSLIKTAEREHRIPPGLLMAIAHVESGIKPYALNIAGKSVIANSAAEASEIVLSQLDKGHNNIDLGVMQINFRWHGEKFHSLAKMLSPANNIDYAARLLTSLYKQHGTWHKAVRHYHSANPKYHTQYSLKVLQSWKQQA